MKRITINIELDVSQMVALHDALNSKVNEFRYTEWSEGVPEKVCRHFVKIVELRTTCQDPDEKDEVFPKFIVTLEVRTTYYEDTPRSNVTVLELRTPMSIFGMIFHLAKVNLFPENESGDDRVVVASYTKPHGPNLP